MIVQNNSIACQGVILGKKLAGCCIIIAKIVNLQPLLFVSFSLDNIDIALVANTGLGAINVPRQSLGSNVYEIEITF